MPEDFSDHFVISGRLGGIYNVEGVTYAAFIPMTRRGETRIDPRTDPVEEFAKLVPDEAEWVINFRQTLGGATAGEKYYPQYPYCASGLALIPKK